MRSPNMKPMLRPGLPTTLTTYVLGTGVPIVATAAVLTSAIELFSGPDRAKTLPDERIASARAIRQALETPIAPAEPLPPITAKVEHGVLLRSQGASTLE